MHRAIKKLFAAVALMVTASPAVAATVAGRVVDTSGTGIEGMEVRLWSEADGKGWAPVVTASTDAGGAYSFVDVAAGSYRLDVRLPFLLPGNFADRWFDQDAPTAGGWEPYAADIFVMASDTTLAGVDLVMPLYGGVDGTITADGAEAPRFWARIDRPEQPGNHHNTQANDRGVYSFRGIAPGEGYRLLVVDPTARMETAIVDLGATITVDDVADGVAVDMTPRDPDPYEPNDGPGEGTYEIDAELFHGEERESFITDGAFVGPLGDDIDWYCFEVRQGDRFLAYTITDLGLPGETRESPWVDPMLRFATPSGTVLDENDDARGFGLNAAVDTGGITEIGTVCAVVTTYGDAAWDGTNQTTAGDYTLIIEPGNRLPTFQLFIAESRAPEPPGKAIVGEGDLLRIDIEASDPDGDPLDGYFSHVDVEGESVEGGELVLTPDGRGSYTWRVPDDGARFAPYEITITVTDGEFDVYKVVLVQPRTVNIAPEAPVLLSPEDGASVDTWTPTLEVENAVDVDNDILTYEFEVHYGDPSEAPDEIGRIGENPDGTTSWTASRIDENQRVSWRARASDGAVAGGTSPWSEYWTFVVNADNEVPSTPTLVKPDEGATVPQRTPTLSAENTSDPDGDNQFMVFEVASDPDFATIVSASDPVEQNTMVGRTTWSVEPPLEWGVTYYARVYAEDPRGARSAASNIRQFRIKNNERPERPEYAGVFAEQCADVIFDEGLPSEFVVEAVVDPEGEAVTIDFRIYEYPGDLDEGQPLFQEVVEQPASSDAPHAFRPDASLFELDAHYAVYVRADDGTAVTDWVSCDFWLPGDNQPPGPVSILSPEQDELLPESAEQVLVVVSNADDPNGAGQLELAWCAANLDAETGCPSDPAEWNRTPQASGERTEFTIGGVFPGASIGLRVAAMDPGGLVGPIAEVRFSVDQAAVNVTPSLCSCDTTASGRSGAGGWMLAGRVALAGARRRRD